MALDINTLIIVVGFIAMFWFVNKRVGQVDQRVGQVDQRVGQVDQRVGQVGQRVGQVDQRVGHVDQRISEVQAEVRYEITPDREAAIERSILVVLNSHDVPVGVAFFVSGYSALTVRHNLVEEVKVKAEVGPKKKQMETTQLRVMEEVRCKRLTDKRLFTFKVKYSHEELDFAVLQLSSGQGSSHDFLPIADKFDVFKRESMFLVTCSIRLAEEAPEASDVGMALHKARVTRSDKPHHFLYDASSFDGDSGGAIVVARTGHVVGLHQQLVNAAEELVQHKSTVGERLSAVERSLMSLIRGNSHGCLGLRMDAHEVQAALK